MILFDILNLLLVKMADNISFLQLGKGTHKRLQVVKIALIFYAMEFIYVISVSKNCKVKSVKIGCLNVK